ncbi:hypothetical protein ACFWVC_36850 [Streptomyces sp. NPDC058691]
MSARLAVVGAGPAGVAAAVAAAGFRVGGSRALHCPGLGRVVGEGR